MKLHSFKGLDLSFLTDETRKKVFDNLNAAKEGGYYAERSTWTVRDIIYDLQAFAEDCQDLSYSELQPHVEAWVKAQH